MIDACTQHPHTRPVNSTLNPLPPTPPKTHANQVLAAPGSTKTFKEFEAELYVLTQEEGGRHTPFLNNYRPQFYVRTADVTGERSAPAI